MEYRLLGPVDVIRDGRPIALGGAKASSLLALLVLHANEVVSRDRLIDALWGDRPPGTAEHSLDVQVSRLRKAFEPEEPLVTRRGGYLLEVEPERVDVRRFEQLLEQGRQANAEGDHARALTTLDAALGLWRGNALGDLAYEEFARIEAERLDELRLVAIEERIDAELALGRHDTLIPELETLTAKHPLRERLRSQLMLALYRSGRQAEALRVYTDARRRLVEELGLEPSQQLRELEQAILRQDPALDLPRGPLGTRRRRVAVGALAAALAALAVAVVVAATQGGTESAGARAQPDSNVFVSAASGELVRAAPVRDTVRVAYGAGSLWSVSSTGDLTRFDPSTGKEIAHLDLGVRPAGLAVGAGSVWVTDRSTQTLVRVDPTVNEIVEKYSLPTKDVETDQTGEVAVGAGSVWVGHGAFNPGAWVERLDPRTVRGQGRVPILGGDADHLAFTEGALWVASTSSGALRKIDPRSNTVIFTRTLQAALCCVTAGGGYAWAASNPDGVVWKVGTDGTRLPTIELGSPIESLSYADGALWAALGDEGTFVRVDPTTGDTRTYDLGNSVTSVDVRDGLIAAGVRHTIEDVAGDLSGDVAWVAHKGPALFDSGAPVDPAFAAPTWDAWQEMFHYATCARLLNYPDVDGGPGRQVVPEVAEELPEVSDGARTFRFTLREGFGFSPPSDEQVTAESFRRALERTIDLARLSGDDLSPTLGNLVGAKAYYAGKTLHIAGITARDRELVVRFREPQPDLLWVVAGSGCAVPANAPVVKDGLEDPVPSAGPYYLAALTDSHAVLRMNPNYGGSRPQHLDAIVVELNVPPAEAATRIENGTLDYFLESQNPTLRPETQAAHTAGDRYGLTPGSTQRIQFYFFNSRTRRLFADLRTRRAVQYALDRDALASVGGGLVATRLLSSGVLGYDKRPLYPPRGDVGRAHSLVAGRTADIVVYTWDDPETEALNNALREQLAAIGLHMKVSPMLQSDPPERWLAKAKQADLVWGGLNANTADPAAYLRDLDPFLPADDASELRRVQTLLSPARERSAIALARKIDRQSLFAVYVADAIPELVSRRLGCIVHQPEYAGVDLAALCLREEHG